MAIYQFVIELLPLDWVKKNEPQAIKYLYVDDDEYDTSSAWKAYSLPASFDSVVSKILPSGKSWSKDLKVWGSDNENDIQLWTDNNSVESVKIRLDLRGDIDELKAKLLIFANEFHYSFFIPELRSIIGANLDELNKALKKSRAFMFVNDPEKFLNNIRIKK